MTLNIPLSVNNLQFGLSVEQDTSPAVVAKIRGITKLLGTPQKMRVGIVHRKTLVIISHFYSASDGNFEYQVNRDFVGKNDLAVVVFDDGATVNASVVDSIEPEVI